MNKCIFCEINNNNIPSYTLYEDNIIKVFLDIKPERPGHTLIIPKNHYQDINDIPMEVLNHILKVSKDIAKLLKDKLNYDGISLCENNGYGQEVKHFHLHLIPKYKDEQKLSVEEVYNMLK